MTRLYDSETGYDPGIACGCCEELVDVNECTYSITRFGEDFYFCSYECAYDYVSDRLDSYLDLILD